MDDFRPFSVRYKGAKHDSDEPCQDAATHVLLENALMAVVADGHGSSRCFRSDIGSQAVVDAAENIIKYSLQDLSETAADPEDFRTELHKLVKQIINRWFAAVMKDDETNPLPEDPRLEGISDKYKDRYINNPDYRSHAYGTTLMLSVMSENYWFGFQVGDGKCVVLYEDGSWKTPIPWDSRCAFNTTTSICDDDSLSSFRYWFGLKESDGSYTEYGDGVEGQGRDYVTKALSRPLAIFVASDGVEDSYPSVDNDRYVINFYRNRIIELTEDGFDSFKETMDGFAKRFADYESKDDVSVACILGDFSHRTDMISQMKRESEIHTATEMAAVKRRDANEKRDALNAIESRTNAVTTNQRQLEGKKAACEQEICDLEAKKQSCDAVLARDESEIAATAHEMSEIKGKASSLERECASLLRDEKTLSSDVSHMDSQVRIAQIEWDKANDAVASKQEAVAKAEEKLKKHLVSQPQSQPTGTGTGFMDTVRQVFTPDAEMLARNLDNAKSALEAAQSQADTARQRYESKRDELTPLQQQLTHVQEKLHQVENQLRQLKHAYHKAERQNHNQQAAVAQCRSEIVSIEKQTKRKQMESDKLQAELETFRGQNQKHIEKLAEIKAAWEAAEAEANKYEAIIQQQ